MAENKNLSCIKTYELIQQTPIIHFQHNQAGATLRATEVKPKLDKFIIEKMGGEKNVDKKWFIGDTGALNYKMQIVATGEPEKSNTIDLAIQINEMNIKRGRNPKTPEQKNKEAELRNEINAMYFGNMVGSEAKNYEQEVREKYKESLFHKDKINLKIICLIKDLSDYIEQNIEEFFLTHNFGTRQSKGFGGFVLSSSTKSPIEILEENNYDFFYTEVSEKNDYKNMLEHAKNIYAILKGGYNLTGWDERNKCYKNEKKYIKGYIQRQFFDDLKMKTVGSDKAYIKTNKKFVKYKKSPGEFVEYEYPNERKGQPSEYKYKEYLFSRALLGLADHYEFKDSSRKGSVEIFSLGNKDFDVKRFKSPVTIKIVNNYIIFIFGDFSGICNKTFYISPNGYNKEYFDELGKYEDQKKYIETNSTIFKKIITPDNVDVPKLIGYFVNYFNVTKKNDLRDFGGSVSRTGKLTLKKGEKNNA